MRVFDRIRSYFTPFQWFEILAVVIFTVYFAAIDKVNPWWYILVSSIAAVCGIVCVVLCAAGRKSQYYWGFFNIFGYIIIAWLNRYYGEVMLNALYYLPTQFIGLFIWSRNYNESSNSVRCKKMSMSQICIYLVISGIFVSGYQVILSELKGNATWLDSTSTILSVIANALMVFRYREQWILWIVVDIVTVVMWVLAGDWIMTTMWSVFLLNACYGLYKWSLMDNGCGNLGLKDEVVKD